MAIYHLEAKVVSRGAGRSACAASAYMSCSAIYNDYDGVQHDYTRKQGLVWEHIFLPDCAPVEWQDRAKLWNAVEEAEKTKGSRLAKRPRFTGRNRSPTLNKRSGRRPLARLSTRALTPARRLSPD